ncbi:hypothetical protein [Cryobacterium sp. TMT2-14]|uniref:hypothetical protein n=1 Tax=Cryobacterium sp. TMT2-14 TaxID=1259245 RepID=UPI00141AA055|nr:hypothetical protein [Cryobacterium sp. TMT2-14]
MAFVALFAVSVSLAKPGPAAANPQSQLAADAPQVVPINEADTVSVLHDVFTVGRVQKP